MPAPTPIALTRRLSAVLAFLLLPSLASAHIDLRSSEPAKDSRVSVAPARIALWFTARPQLAFSKIRLVGPFGEIALDKLVADSGNAIHANIQRALGPGEYAVHWQTASADGHPIRGAFTFVVVGASDTAQAATAPHDRHEPRPEAHTEHSEYRTARWIEFVALLTVLGVLGFRHGVLPPLAARGVPTSDAADRARRLGQSAIGLYLLAALIRLYTESVAVHGAGRALDPNELLPMMSSTSWGFGWLLGVVGALLLFTGWTVSKRSVTIGTPLALTGALGMALSPALSGHAAASRQFVLSVTLDVLHVVAAGVWVGGVLLVLIAGVPAMLRLTDGNRDAAVSALVNSFHPLALFCAPIVVLAGAGSSWLRLGGLSVIWSTPYGQTLLVKIALFSLVAMMGTYNALRARRRLGVAEGTRHVRLTGSVEVILAALVLAATTFLVVTPVPSEMAMP